MHNSVEKFTKECIKCQELFAEKNKQYGDTIWKTGVLGACIELIGAVARLPMLVLRSPRHGRENKDSLKDVLMDIHNYASIGLMMLEANNWEGEE